MTLLHVGLGRNKRDRVTLGGNDAMGSKATGKGCVDKK